MPLLHSPPQKKKTTFVSTSLSSSSPYRLDSWTEARHGPDIWKRSLELFYGCPIGAFLDNELQKVRATSHERWCFSREWEPSSQRYPCKHGSKQHLQLMLVCFCLYQPFRVTVTLSKHNSWALPAAWLRLFLSGGNPYNVKKKPANSVPLCSVALKMPRHAVAPILFSTVVEFGVALLNRIRVHQFILSWKPHNLHQKTLLAMMNSYLYIPILVHF